MPRLVGAARLHRRDDMYQAGVFATSFQHLRHDGFLADVALGDVLDRDPRLRCQRCRPLAHAVAQRRGKLRVIEDANPDRVEKLRHSRGVAHRGKRPGHHHPVVTGQHAGDPIVIALRERPCHLALDSFGTGGRCYPLFGSGSAGLGAHSGVYSAPTDGATGIIFDQTIALNGHYPSQHYPEHLRRIRLRDAESGKTLVFLTNQFGLPATTICALYKSRWQVELFFKWIKQHLRIKRFFGTSENAVKTQIWIAVSVYVLVAIVKKRLTLDASLYTLLQILSVTLFEKLPLDQALTHDAAKGVTSKITNQLNLFAY